MFKLFCLQRITQEAGSNVVEDVCRGRFIAVGKFFCCPFVIFISWENILLLTHPFFSIFELFPYARVSQTKLCEELLQHSHSRMYQKTNYVTCILTSECYFIKTGRGINYASELQFFLDNATWQRFCSLAFFIFWRFLMTRIQVMW